MQYPRRLFIWLLVLSAGLSSDGAQTGPTIAFRRDTFAFANDTVFAYENGHPSLRQDQTERYTARCFVMSRAVVQFKKFARFEPSLAPLDDEALADRIRQVTRRPPWDEAADERERIVIPGARDLRELSRTQARLLQANIGLGWPTYFRPGNWRVLLPRFPGQQVRTKNRLDDTLAEGGYFVAYITTLPNNLNINHAILIFARHDNEAGDSTYAVYDPTFPDAPRTLTWSAQERAFSYPPNPTFVGGRVYVWHVYGAPLQ